MPASFTTKARRSSAAIGEQATRDKIRAIGHARPKPADRPLSGRESLHTPAMRGLKTAMGGKS